MKEPVGKIHPLMRWKLDREPPWTTKYLAWRLGCQIGWLSTIINSGFKKRGGAELAYSVEILTNGEIKALDMLLLPQERREIEERINQISYGFLKNQSCFVISLWSDSL